MIEIYSLERLAVGGTYSHLTGRGWNTLPGVYVIGHYNCTTMMFVDGRQQVVWMYSASKIEDKTPSYSSTFPVNNN